MNTCPICQYNEDIKIDNELSGEMLFDEQEQLCDRHNTEYIKLNITKPINQIFIFHDRIADIKDVGCYCNDSQCMMFMWTHEMYNVYASWASKNGKCDFCQGCISHTDIILRDGTMLDQCECGRYYYKK
jgi:hypothetical protein